jgi:hypothetical protein
MYLLFSEVILILPNLVDTVCMTISVMLVGDASGESSLPAEVSVDLEEVKSEGATEPEGKSQKTEVVPPALPESKEVVQNTEQSKEVASAPVQSQPTTPLISYSDQVKKQVSKKKEVPSEAKPLEESKTQAENKEGVKVDTTDNKEVVQKKTEDKPVVKSEDKAQNTDALLNKNVAMNTNKIEIKDASQNTVSQAEPVEHKSQNTDSVQTKDVAQNTDVVKSQNVAQNTNKEITSPKSKGGKPKVNGNKITPQNKATMENKNKTEKAESTVVSKDPLPNIDNLNTEAVAVECKEAQIIKSELVKEPIGKSKEDKSKGKSNANQVTPQKQDISSSDSARTTDKLPPVSLEVKSQDKVVNRDVDLNTNTAKPLDVAQNIAKEPNEKSKGKNIEKGHNAKQVSPKKQAISDTNVAQNVETLSSPVTGKEKSQNSDPVISKDAQPLGAPQNEMKSKENGKNADKTTPQKSPKNLNKSPTGKAKGEKEKQNEKGQHGSKVIAQKQDVSTPDSQIKEALSSPVTSESKSLVETDKVITSVSPSTNNTQPIDTPKSPAKESNGNSKGVKGNNKGKNHDKVLAKNSSSGPKEIKENLSSPVRSEEKKTDTDLNKAVTPNKNNTQTSDKLENSAKVVVPDINKNAAETLTSPKVNNEGKNLKPDTVINKDALKEPTGKSKGDKTKGQEQNADKIMSPNLTKGPGKNVETLMSPVPSEDKEPPVNPEVALNVNSPPNASKAQTGKAKGGKNNKDKGQNGKKSVPFEEKLPTPSADGDKCQSSDALTDRMAPNVNTSPKAAKGKGQNSKPILSESKDLSSGDTPENTTKLSPVTGKENPDPIRNRNEVENKAPVLNVEATQTKDISQIPITNESKDVVPVTNPITPPAPVENPSSVEKGESITPGLLGEVKANGNPQQPKSAKHRKRAKHNKS